jgi:hypothetical protein
MEPNERLFKFPDTNIGLLLELPLYRVSTFQGFVHLDCCGDV